jgi:hypothetical protein
MLRSLFILIRKNPIKSCTTFLELPSKCWLCPDGLNKKAQQAGSASDSHMIFAITPTIAVVIIARGADMLQRIAKKILQNGARRVPWAANRATGNNILTGGEVVNKVVFSFGTKIDQQKPHLQY